MLAALVGSSTTADEATVLRRAANAFEYRDFDRVIALLDPWLHPPRIADDARMVEARRLMGVSLHIKGDVRGAREEFSQLLLLAPAEELDPFVVPPFVIETFETVKQEMKGVLELRAPKPPPPPPPLIVHEPRLVVVPDPAVRFLPLGLAHFLVLEDAKAWGATWLGLQLAGLALNVGSYFAASGLEEGGFLPAHRQTDRDVLVGLMYAGAAVAGGAYVGSVLHAGAALERQRSDLLAPNGGPTLGFGLGFTLE